MVVEQSRVAISDFFLDLQLLFELRNFKS